MLLSLVNQRMRIYPLDCAQLLLHLAMACCMDETCSRPSMANVVQGLEAIWQLVPHSDSKMSSKASQNLNASATRPRRGLLLSIPYVSSKIDGNGLKSGYIPFITPR